MYFYLARLWRARLGYQRATAFRAALDAGRVAAGLLTFSEGLDAFAFAFALLASGAFALASALAVLEAAGVALGAAGAFGLAAAAFFGAVAGVFFAAGGALLGALGLAFGVGAGVGAGWASPKASRVDVLSPSGVPPIGLFVRLLRKINHSGLLGSA